MQRQACAGTQPSWHHQPAADPCCAPICPALQVDQREVTAEEGSDFAKAHGLVYRETSARTDQGVYDALVWGLVCAIVDTPELLRSHGSGGSGGGQSVNLGAGDAFDVPRRGRGHSWCCV